jgi:2-hydroxychromene-2-carboxylate isomerase
MSDKNAGPIEFYFDFASPYAYIAAPRLIDLAQKHGRVLHWRPFLLWTVMKARNLPAPLDNAAKAAYLTNDMARSARFLGMPYVFPKHFPTSAHLPCRAFYWVESTRPDLAPALAQRLFEAYFVRGIDPRDAQAVAAEAEALGLSRSDCLAALQADAWKEALRQAGLAAEAAGVFGSPFVIIDGEAFFGADRLPQIERWLEEGGF